MVVVNGVEVVVNGVEMVVKGGGVVVIKRVCSIPLIERRCFIPFRPLTQSILFVEFRRKIRIINLNKEDERKDENGPHR